jgi:hypothetical protein
MPNKKRKLKRPCFVKVRLMLDGIVEAVDDEGERFYLSMHKGEPWPMLSRLSRRFENETAYQEYKRGPPEPPPQAPPPELPPFKPKLVG